MSVTVDLPRGVLRRLQAEATRRGVTIDEVIAELAAGLPPERSPRPKRLSFVALGASGDTRLFDIHRERDELSARFGSDRPGDRMDGRVSPWS
jgi:hypothetical protein